MNLYIKSTEHKTTRKPCEDFKAQVYHLGEYTGRAMDMLEEMEHGEADLIRNYGMKEAALREGLVYFSQMQCMQRTVLKYVRLPGPLLGVSTDAASLTCQGGETKLDKDEDKATLAIEKMITQWTQWETSSGIRDAIQARLSHDERNNGKTGQQGIRHQLQEAAVRLGKLRQSGGVGFYGARSGYYLAQQERGACRRKSRNVLMKI